jgi:hypothetical protein
MDQIDSLKAKHDAAEQAKKALAQSGIYGQQSYQTREYNRDGDDDNDNDRSGNRGYGGRNNNNNNDDSYGNNERSTRGEGSGNNESGAYGSGGAGQYGSGGIGGGRGDNDNEYRKNRDEVRRTRGITTRKEVLGKVSRQRTGVITTTSMGGRTREMNTVVGTGTTTSMAARTGTSLPDCR